MMNPELTTYRRVFASVIGAMLAEHSKENCLSTLLEAIDAHGLASAPEPSSLGERLTAYHETWGSKMTTNQKAWFARVVTHVVQHGEMSPKQGKTVNDIAESITGERPF